jgi:hypothetical protein
MKQNYISYYSTLLLSLALLMTACKEEEYALPTAKEEFQNDCIKRTLGPNLVGQPIEFAYAMALPPGLGRITSAQVEASIAGASGTFLEHRAYFTNTSGTDVARTIGNPSSNDGVRTQVIFTRDTFATTLRYTYVVPPEARGKEVSFNFSALDTNGETVSYSMGPYTVSNMDMVLDRVTTDNAAMYISIEDMTVYTAAQAAANPGKIDLVYLYRVIPNVTFNHALVAPAADPIYLPGVTLPPGVNKNTKIIKNLNLRDRHLARLQYGIYIDDVDFQTIDMSASSNFAINVKNEGGVWVETADGKYRAFVYINTIVNTATNKNMTISMKRLQMF